MSVSVRVCVQLACDVSSDGQYFVTAHNGFDSDGCMVKLWDRRKAAVVQEFVGHSQAVYDCAFLPSNGARMRIASCSKDQSIRVWESGDDAAVQAPGGAPVGSGNGGGACLSTTTLRKSPCEIRCLAVSPHHSGPAVLYSGSGDGFINVWHVKNSGKLDCVAQSKRAAAGV
jgi:WD40 repeat protein